MPDRTRRPPRSLDPEKDGESGPGLTLGIPGLGIDPSLLGNQELLDLIQGRTQGPTKREPTGLLDFDNPNPKLDPRLPMPILDGVPFGGKVKGTVNDWLQDPYGKNGPDPKPTAPETRDGDPLAPTIIKSPKIPF